MVYAMAALVVSIVSIIALSAFTTPGGQANDPEASFRAFLAEFEHGTTQFINGDAALWKRHVSPADDVTIMGGWGAWEQGARAVDQRYDWAVKRFRAGGATNVPTYLARGVSGDLAYTVTIERSVVRLIDREAPQSMTLRVTTIFRREAGTWKLVHRHEDPLIAKTAPSAVIEKSPPQDDPAR
jgi:ketosteroid isomerase-like protein